MKVAIGAVLGREISCPTEWEVRVASAMRADASVGGHPQHVWPFFSLSDHTNEMAQLQELLLESQESPCYNTAIGQWLLRLDPRAGTLGINQCILPSLLCGAADCFAYCRIKNKSYNQAVQTLHHSSAGFLE